MSESDTLKTCSRKDKCVHPDGATLPLSEFYRHAGTSDGLRAECKACKNQSVKKYRENNAEKVSAYGKQYRQTNREACYAVTRQWALANPEKRRETYRKYRNAHPEKGRAIEHRRRARKRLLPAQLTKREWQWLLEQSGSRCVYCGRHESEVGTLIQEHVKPLAQGGAYTITNIRPSCRPCNSRKNNRTPAQAGMTFAIEISPMKHMKQLELIP